jgi:hypothetical protein
MGLLVLAGVMFVAFKNDIERKLGDRPPPVAGVLVRG